MRYAAVAVVALAATSASGPAPPQKAIMSDRCWLNTNGTNHHWGD
jgi:hypothetical protein